MASKNINKNKENKIESGINESMAIGSGNNINNLGSRYYKINKKNSIITILAVISLVVLFGIYIHYTNSLLKQDYDAKIQLLESELVASSESLNSKISTLDNNLDANMANIESLINEQNDLFLEMVKTVRNESLSKNKELASRIADVDAKSQEKLHELKEDLETDIQNIQVTSTDFSAIVDDVLKSVVSVLTDKSQGSGSFITNSGHIITNYHVISTARVIKVNTYDKVLHNAELVGVDANNDIAVLKINNDTFPRLRFEDYSNVKVGEKVIAVGNPGGFDFSVSEGIVSAVNRKASNNNLYIQTDVPINPGNSGGPLINTKGKVIGINNFKIQGFEGVGFALNSDKAKETSDNIING